MLSPLPTSREAWVFPVPDLGDRRPEVSDGWASTRTSVNEETKATVRRLHLGADIMFRRRTPGELGEVYRAGTRHGTRHYFMPDMVPAIAASAGVVIFAQWTGVGFTVKVFHPEGWTTYYTHLSLVSVAEGQAVVAGQPVGIVGFDPKDRRKLMHLLCAAAHKRCNAERHVMRSERRRRAIPRNPRRPRLHITETSRRSR